MKIDDRCHQLPRQGIAELDLERGAGDGKSFGGRRLGAGGHRADRGEGVPLHPLFLFGQDVGDGHSDHPDPFARFLHERIGVGDLLLQGVDQASRQGGELVGGDSLVFGVGVEPDLDRFHDEFVVVLRIELLRLVKKDIFPIGARLENRIVLQETGMLFFMALGCCPDPCQGQESRSCQYFLFHFFSTSSGAPGLLAAPR